MSQFPEMNDNNTETTGHRDAASDFPDEESGVRSYLQLLYKYCLSVLSHMKLSFLDCICYDIILQINLQI